MTEVESLHRRVIELEGRILQRDDAIRMYERVLRELREREGNGFREEVNHFSVSTRDMIEEVR